MVSSWDRSPSILPSPEKSMYIKDNQYFLSEQVVKNIEKIISFQNQQEEKLPIQERAIQNIASFFGKSEFLYLQLLFFTTWAICSHFIPQILPLSFPQFDLQGMGIDIAALLITTGVLIQQNRQDKLAEQRSHLILQINLLTEHKIAKLINLMEELRADIPDIKNRYDWEAQIMQQATDPQVILNILQENLEQAEIEVSTSKIKQKLVKKAV